MAELLPGTVSIPTSATGEGNIAFAKLTISVLILPILAPLLLLLLLILLL